MTLASPFKPSPVLYDDGRHAGVDGPLIPVLVAPMVVAPVAAP